MKNKIASLCLAGVMSVGCFTACEMDPEESGSFNSGLENGGVTKMQWTAALENLDFSNLIIDSQIIMKEQANTLINMKGHIILNEKKAAFEEWEFSNETLQYVKISDYYETEINGIYYGYMITEESSANSSVWETKNSTNLDDIYNQIVLLERTLEMARTGMASYDFDAESGRYYKENIGEYSSDRVEIELQGDKLYMVSTYTVMEFIDGNEIWREGIKLDYFFIKEDVELPALNELQELVESSQAA